MDISGWRKKKKENYTQCVVSIHHTADATHLRALSDKLVMEVQEARSRCFSFGQNLLRLLHVLQRGRGNIYKDKVHYIYLQHCIKYTHTCQ